MCVHRFGYELTLTTSSCNHFLGDCLRVSSESKATLCLDSFGHSQHGQL